MFFFKPIQRFFLFKSMGSIFKMNLFCKVFGYKVVFSKTLKGFLVRDISKQGLKINIGSMSRGWLYLGGIFYRLNQLATSYMVASMHIKSGDVILDVGANVGELGMFFNEKGVEVSYHSFEPAHREHECCLLNNEKHQHHINNLGLWSKQGSMTFFNKNESADSSLIEMKGYKTKNQVKVDTIDDYVVRNNIKSITLLKLEAEGGELEILQGACESLKIIKYIAADLGYERGLKKEQTFTVVTNFLLENNFELINIYPKGLKGLYKNKSIDSNRFDENSKVLERTRVKVPPKMVT
jgi:FkbM family methyltransferase